MRILEVCAGDLASVQAAVDGGASRVELCSALEEGGITPSAGFISEAAAILRPAGVRLHVLIRPRGGDFAYSPAEFRSMLADIKMISALGLADGVVIGALNPDGTINIAQCRAMIEAAGDLSVTFHRAFDRVRDPLEALEQIINLKCDRLLTSGQASSAFEGTHLLRQLVDKAGQRLSIIAAGGVNPGNAAEILQRSGASEIHASARAAVESLMTYHGNEVAMGSNDSDNRMSTSADIVAQIVKQINN